jgi:hypothetical protein
LNPPVLRPGENSRATHKDDAMKDTSEGLSRLYHFRLTEADGQVWDDKIARSGMKISPFMRLAVVHNETVVIGDVSNKKKRPTRTKANANPDIQKTNFLLAAISRNMNQIAHRLNSDNLMGLVTPASYAAVLDELHSISAQIKAQM